MKNTRPFSKKNESIHIPPHSEEAEISILGALLLDKDAIISVAEFLKSFHFYDDRHKEIYETIISLYEERSPIDVLTVSERLKKRKSLEKVGGTPYLQELLNRVPTAAHVEHYGKIVKDAATKRSLMQKATHLVDLSFDESIGADELLDKAESEIFSLTQTHLTGSFTPIRSALADSFDRLDELHKLGNGLRGVPTGFPELDNLLAGLQKSNLIILAARPGVGKTALAVNIAQHLAVKEKRPVGMFSLEMSKEELLDRLLTAQADIDAWKLKTGKLNEEDFTKLSNAMGELAEAPFYIDDTPALSILEMRTKARRLQVEYGIDLLIIDYLQLARSRNLENRVQEVSEISQGFKNLARELKIPILALSQLSRSVESRGSKKPQLSDLRESGCLTGNTLIMNANTGERATIKSLVNQKNFPLFAVTKDLKLCSVRVNKIFPSGKKQVYRLLLKSGRSLEASENHPFLTLSGWTRLDNLQTGTRIAVPRVLPTEASRKLPSISDDKLILLAHLIGDGCYVRRQPLHYTNSDLKLIAIVKNSATHEFTIKPRLVKQQNWYHLYLSAQEKLARGHRNPIVKWLDETLGIYGQHSRQKLIPELVFSQSTKKIALFLKHLWSTDGCIFLYHGKSKQKVSLYYATGSKKLANGVAHLLLRLGILSTIGKSIKKGYEPIWQVQIQGKTDQLKFLMSVGIAGEKETIVKKAIIFLQSLKENPNNDCIPKEIWEYIETLRRQKKWSTREFHRKMNWAYNGTQRHSSSIGRVRLQKIAQVLEDKYLDTLANSHLYWDEVKTVENLGVEDVFDITVPKYANFIANDILVHNSIEQDSDVVMFLWREDEEDIVPGKPLNIES